MRRSEARRASYSIDRMRFGALPFRQDSVNKVLYAGLLDAIMAGILRRSSIYLEQQTGNLTVRSFKIREG